MTYILLKNYFYTKEKSCIITKLVQTALLMAVCLVSQLFKNLSVYITGPIINAAIIIAAVVIGLGYCMALCVLTPITAWLITGSPITTAIPTIIVAIMVGNAILGVCAWLFNKKWNNKFAAPAGMVVGTCLKALFMWLSISCFLLPVFASNIAVPAEKLTVLVSTAKITYSVTQFTTGLIGSVYACIILIPIKKYLNKAN